MALSKAVKDSKLVIMYHRSYRKLPGSTKNFIIQYILLAIPFSVIAALFYPELTKAICSLAKEALSPYYYLDSVNLFSKPYIEQIGPVYYLDLPESFPTFWFSLVNALVAIALLLILPNLNKFKPLLIFMTLLSIVHLISSVYFLLFPSYFPYTAGDYSQLYMIQEISIWFFLPLIMGLAVLPLPSSLFLKILTMCSIFVYSIIFGTVRYIVFLFILSKISMIYMAILFFALGPLVDFIYAVGLYTLFVNKLAIKLAEDFSIWRWQ